MSPRVGPIKVGCTTGPVPLEERLRYGGKHAAIPTMCDCPSNLGDRCGLRLHNRLVAKSAPSNQRLEIGPDVAAVLRPEEVRRLHELFDLDDVDRAVSGSTHFSHIGSAPASVTNWTDYSPQAGQTYQYRVRALDHNGDTGPASSVITLKIP